MAKKRRSECPIACTLDLIGDKWTLLVIRDLSIGKRFYGDFLKSPEGIATNILANRLELLTERGLIEKYETEDTPARDAYRLTLLGRSLRPVVRSIVRWGLEHLDGTNTDAADAYIQSMKGSRKT